MYSYTKPTHIHTANPLYSTIHIAHILKVSRITVFRYIKEGKLKAVKQGRNYRISRSAYDSFVLEHCLTKEQQDKIKAQILKMVLAVRDELMQTHPADRPDISRIISKD